MLEKMLELIRTHDICVLATTSEGLPHCSLMAYVCDDQCRHLYMATGRDSVKFRNLQKNPAVSLLVDTRETHRGGERAGTKALTAAGVYEPMKNPVEIATIKSMLLAAHPQLKVILETDAYEIISVKPTSFLLLDGLTESTFLEL